MAYEQYLVPVVYRPFAEDLTARAAALHPRRILELAAGTDVLTAELLAAAPFAEVTATDLNEATVTFGPTRSGCRSRTGGFDLVVCQFGVMFFPDRT
ncbi:hypothetical protein [Streptomyces sp. NPDC003023]|uniref:hypothetical protein n=1 Tax=Streptomyces sp. NPDC003023 TaxID=3364675 RepID=UPI0036765FA6